MYIFQKIIFKIFLSMIQTKDQIHFMIGYYNLTAFFEKNDCSVYSLSIAFLIPYLQAHYILEKYGTVYQKGCKNWDDILEDLEKDGYIERLDDRRIKTYYKYKKRYSIMTVETFRKKNPKGVFLLTTRDHIVTIRDGIIYDRFDSGRYRVLIANKIIKNKLFL